MASFSFGIASEDDFTKRYELWLCDKLKSFSADPDADVSVFSNYILSTLSEEDNTDEEKSEAIKPFMEEINPVRLYYFCSTRNVK